MKTESIDKIRGLAQTSRGLRSFWKSFRTTTGESNCDKHDAAFNKDDRFAIFSAKVHFDAYTGYYGRSSCSTFNNGISGELAGRYFVRAINNMKEEIFNEMAVLMEQDAKDLKDEARDGNSAVATTGRICRRSGGIMTQHSIQLEPGALDGIPIIVLSDLLAKYGSELATVNGQLIIRKVRRNYKGCTIAPTRHGRLEVLAPPPGGELIGEASTLEDAKRLVDQQFQYEGPGAA